MPVLTAKPMMFAGIPMPTFTFKGMDGRWNDSGSGVAPPLTMAGPSERDAGDLLIGFAQSTRFSGSAEPSYDADWSLDYHEVLTGDRCMAVATRTATDDSSDDWGLIVGGSYTFTDGIVANIAVETSATTVTADANATPYDAPSVTAPGPGHLLIIAGAADADTPPDIDTPSGFTLLDTEEFTKGGSTPHSHAAFWVFHKQVHAAGSTGTVSITESTGAGLSIRTTTVFLSA